MNAQGWAMVLFGCVAAVLLGGGCATFSSASRQPLTQEQIIQLAKSSTPDAVIIARIRESGTVYRLTASEIVHLHKEGVSFAVLDFLLQSYVEAVRDDQRLADERFWTLYFGHHYWWPPHVIVAPRR